jgi:hypothetical protein
MVPGRAGTDTRVDIHIGLADLCGMDGASLLKETWLAAKAGQHGYLTGTDAQAIACDALIVPVVTGTPDGDAIRQIIYLVLQAHGVPAQDQPAAQPAPGRCPPRPGKHSSTPWPTSPSASCPGPEPSPPSGAPGSCKPPATARASPSTSASPRSRFVSVI